MCFIVVKLRASSHGWKGWKPPVPEKVEPTTLMTLSFPCLSCERITITLAALRPVFTASVCSGPLIMKFQWRTTHTKSPNYLLNLINIWYLVRIWKSHAWRGSMISLWKDARQLWVPFRLLYISVELSILFHTGSKRGESIRLCSKCSCKYCVYCIWSSTQTGKCRRDKMFMALLPPLTVYYPPRAVEYWKKDVAEFGHSRTQETTSNTIMGVWGDRRSGKSFEK